SSDVCSSNLELVRAEEIPIGTTKKGSKNHKQNPKNQETEQECRNFPAALSESEVPISFRIRVDVRNGHQPDDDESRENDTCQPGIEVYEHFLQSKEVPGRLGRIR